MTRTFVPIYARILDTLRQRIAEGVYRVGESLPTEAELVLEFNVSRQTVRSALQNLVAGGIVERTAGRGTFLKRGGSGGGEWNIGGIEDIIDIGFSGSYAVKSVQTVTAARNARIAGVLGVPPGGRMLNVRATRSTREGPFAYSSLYFPEEIGERLPRHLFDQRSLVLLVEEYCGIPAFRSRQVASATLADRSVAKVLDVAIGEPLLVLERTHFARDGRPFQFVRVLYRTDRYQQVVYFSRRDEGPYRTPQQRAAQMEEVAEPMAQRRAANSRGTS
ncbi:GntR family transcriptional regulator [Reyranella sp.]|uniref:GntR family transcriptional regulator n=1 Tax=Reyranella sp. TaxID=1929291 RepID=UPI0037842B3C